MEEWRAIKEFPNYEVSSYGNVRSVPRKIWNGKVFFDSKGKELKKMERRDGYLEVKLSMSGKTSSKLVHRLVATEFLDGMLDGNSIIVDHIDNNPSNNHISNLQIITQRENCSKDKWRHGKTSKYTGVYWDKKINKWGAKIQVNGKNKYLGWFVDESDAKDCYDLALLELI